VAALPAREAENAAPTTYAGPEIANQQRAAYPDLALSLPLDQAFRRALDTAKAMPGWKVVAVDPAAGRIERSDGNPVKDANGRFIKSDLVGYAVMEKRAGWGTEYPEEKRNGEWEYQVFTPDRKVNEKANLNSCFECHKPHANTDFLFTADKIKAASK
jgi:hypothetical protein